MKRIILAILIIVISFPALAQYSVSGGNGVPYETESSSNVLTIYLLNGLSNAQISYTGDGTHEWHKYDTAASSAIDITCTQSGNTSFITNIEDGCGYFVGNTLSSATRYVWIIDYSKYLPAFYSLSIEEEEDLCDWIKLVGDTEAPTLEYYTELGNLRTLDRVYHVIYDNFVWDEDDLTFYNETIDEKVYSPNEFLVEAPLKDTKFTLIGDEFAQHFGLEKRIESQEYEAVAVEVYATTETEREYGENELKVGTGTALGGSAPVEITFTAYANEPVAASYTWRVIKMGDSSADSTTVARFQDRSFTYTFNEEGTFRVALEVIGKNSICIDNSIQYSVFIGETHLDVPNFFSPGSSLGVNDEFRVSYRSILNFHCKIYNRQGNLLYEWTNPAEGWDGKVKGWYVATGVYFYTIDYTTSTGKKKTKSGSINILREKDR
jgi:PKD domain.